MTKIALPNGQYADLIVAAAANVGGTYKLPNGTYAQTVVPVDATGNVLSNETVPLIIFTGESNSGGVIPLSSATTEDLQVKPEVQILNNYTYQFESLQIGVNNLLDHFGFVDNAVFGWDLGLAIEAKNNSFKTDKVYLVKTGHGGSIIAEWLEIGSYWQKFLTRVNAAIDLIKANNKRPQPYVWYTQGINDCVANTDVTVWKNATIAHLAKIRKVLGYCPIIMPRFMENTPAKITYNDALSEIAAADPFVYLIDTSNIAQIDGNHWDYAGMKLIASRMVNTCVNKIGQAEAYSQSQSSAAKNISSYKKDYYPSLWSPLTNSIQSGEYIQRSGAIPAGGLNTRRINATQYFSIIVDYSATSTETEGVIVFLDTVSTDTYQWGVNHAIITGVYQIAGTLYTVDNANGGGLLGMGATTLPGKVKLEKSGNDINYYKSTDGKYWTFLYTKVGALTGLTTIYIKCVFAVANGTNQIRVTYSNV